MAGSCVWLAELWKPLSKLIDWTAGNRALAAVVTATATGHLRGLGHDVVVQDEAVLIFDHTDAQPEFHRYSGLALADPFGVGFKDRENLLRRGDDFALQHAAANLVDLPLGMLHVVIERGQTQRDDRSCSHCARVSRTRSSKVWACSR